MITALFSLFFLSAPTCGDPAAEITKAERKETRARVQAVCQEVGASPIICAYMDAIVVRESSGRAGVRHTKGTRENGLGAMGLSLHWHKDKWWGKDEDPYFCSPEVSATVALAVFHRAFRYHAKNVKDVQMIYGGHFRCAGEGETRHCWIVYPPRFTSDICARMRKRKNANGKPYRCNQRITKKDLGRKISLGERRAFAENMRRDFALQRLQRAFSLG